MKTSSRIILFTWILVALATISKLLFAAKIEWSGFSPIIAIALFSGMIIKDKSKSFLLPLVALFVSDMLIQAFYQLGWFPFAGIYAHQWVNYGILLSVTLLGWALKGRNYSSLLTGAIAAPTLFFLISNFLVWSGHGGLQRPLTFNGLILCYGDALPFYKHALAGTLLFLPALLFLYNYIVKGSSKLTLA